MNTRGKVIPPRISGGNTSATRKEDAISRHEAIILFREARERLLDINNWHQLCGEGSAKFHITDSNGHPLDTNAPEIGNLIRISLPASPNGEGDGVDWVRIEKFENEKNLLKDEEIFGFMVRPVANPVNGRQDDSAHFYSPEATSTFLIVRSANTVIATERGKNEKPNFSPSSWANKLRNVVIAMSAMLGLATPQWKSLVNGLIKGPGHRWAKKII